MVGPTASRKQGQIVLYNNKKNAIFYSLNVLTKNVSLIQSDFFFYLISIALVNGDEIVQACDRHNNETVTLRKHVTNINACENGWSNFSANMSRCIKIARANSIHTTKSIKLLDFLRFSCLSVTSSRGLVF